MTNMKLPAAVLLLGVLVAGCGSVIDADAQENLVATEVHLQQGFEGHWVSVELNGDVHFQARLDSAAPLAGPLAVFNLDVPQGTHQLLIRWVPIDGDRQACISSVNIKLDQTEYYYLGLTASKNSLHIAVQESPFLYV